MDRVYAWGFNASQNTPLYIICILFLKHIDKAHRTGNDTLFIEEVRPYKIVTCPVPYETVVDCVDWEPIYLGGLSNAC